MAKFFFDIRRNRQLISDEEGVEFTDIETAAREAAMALGEIARDELRNSSGLNLAIEVRDKSGRQVVVAALQFVLTTSS